MKYLLPKDYDKLINLCKRRINGRLVFCDMEHPLCYKSGFVYYHRHQASLKLGRWLHSDEHVHHIDGDIDNNSIGNLQLVTCSDHAKIHSHNRDSSCKKKQVVCLFCGKIFEGDKNRKHCSIGCAHRHYEKLKINTDKEIQELILLVNKMSLRDIAKIYGVSDVAVKKRCKKLGIETKNQGYWLKKENIMHI
jgi:hypothetical protein